MTRIKKLLIISVLAALVISVFAANAAARGNEFDAVCDHIEDKYQAKKVKIPFLWLARAVVGIARPAGVKAFKVTIYRDLKFDDIRVLNDEMRTMMRDSFGEEWSPLLRVRSSTGEHVYMNMREAGKNVKVLLVTIQKDEAVVVRAKFNPDKLVEFLDNPRIFGISLGDRERGDEQKQIEEAPPKEPALENTTN